MKISHAHHLFFLEKSRRKNQERKRTKRTSIYSAPNFDFYLFVKSTEMASLPQAAMISANSYALNSPKLLFSRKLRNRNRNRNVNLFTVRASSDESECNDEECAPDKEVGKVSVEWLAGEKTKVAGTYPPRNKGWTGYVEKDTAGQTNIYSVEPAVYIAESAISSGTAGSSSAGAENTAAIAAGLALISVAAASSILIQVSKNQPQMQQTVDYSGPSLSYYISKFKPSEIVQASAPSVTEPPPSILSESSTPEVPQIQSEVNSVS